MKNFLLIIFLAINITCYGQETRTYNNFSIAAGFSGASSSTKVSFGEMVQKKSIVPFRILANTTLKFNTLNKDNTVNLVGEKYKTLRRINSISLSLPIGFEVFQKNFGLGVSQELLSFSFKKAYDSTQIDMPTDLTGSAKIFSTIFSKNQSLNSQIYLVYTLYDSFALKFGIQRDNLALNFNESDKKTKAGMLHSNSVFISIRTNIEK
jgi:hypothetical protein